MNMRKTLTGNFELQSLFGVIFPTRLSKNYRLPEIHLFESKITDELKIGDLIIYNPELVGRARSDEELRNSISRHDHNLRAMRPNSREHTFSTVRLIDVFRSLVGEYGEQHFDRNHSRLTMFLSRLKLVTPDGQLAPIRPKDRKIMNQSWYQALVYDRDIRVERSLCVELDLDKYIVGHIDSCDLSIDLHVPLTTVSLHVGHNGQHFYLDELTGLTYDRISIKHLLDSGF